MHRGFITIYRKIVDWEWYSDTNVFRIFTHLILTANWEPKKWKGVSVKRGQKITSIQHIAEETGLTQQCVRTAIKKLKLTGELTTRSTNKYTLVTLTNYEIYQDKEKQLTSKVTSKTTNEQQTTNKQLTTTKQLKQLKQLNNKTNTSKNNFDDAFEKFWSIYPKKVEKKSAQKKFVGIIKRGEATEDQIIDGVKSYLKSDTVARGFVKNPTTWLNGGCWSDEHQKPVERTANGLTADEQLSMLEQKYGRG